MIDDTLMQQIPRVKPPLDAAFRPAALAHRAFSAQAAAGVWTAQAIYSGQMGGNAGQGELGFAISPSGLYAAAYYDAQSNLLMYTDSMDGTKWSPATSIDTLGYTGLYPSLAFDENNDPAVAYYRCNGIGPMSPSCNAATDGLYLARRVAGLWSPSVVTANPNLTDGMYPALAFVKGKAVIAYQQSSYDAVAKTSTASCRPGRQHLPDESGGSNSHGLF